MLRKGVEGDDEGKVQYGGGWLASEYYVSQAMREIEEAAADVIPFVSIQVPGVDGIQFDYASMVDYILKMFQLDEIAKDPTQSPVMIAITLDGADLSRNIQHVTAGIKILDPRAIDPRSGLPIGVEGSAKIQSRELCFPLKILIAKDNKALYNTHFVDFFNWFKTMGENGFGEYPCGFTITSPQDESSFWKVLKRGGAAKVRTYFCRCCACRSDIIEKPKAGALVCDKCRDSGNSQCFHWDVGDAETLARIQGELDELRTAHAYLQDPDGQKKLKTRLEPIQIDKDTDISNIDFVPVTSSEKSLFAQDYVNHDLEVLKLSRRGSFDERRVRLRVALEYIAKMHDMEGVVGGIDFTGGFYIGRTGCAVPSTYGKPNRRKIYQDAYVGGIQ